MSRREQTTRAGLPLEIAAVWLLLAAVSIAVFVTYSRLDPLGLYHVSRSGLGGGASRLLVLLDFPLALVAIAVLLLLADRRGPTAWVAAVGIVLCAVVLWPGVVDQADLDARPINAIPALGVAVALVLTVLAWRAGGVERYRRRGGDPARVAVAAVAFLLSVPWVLADLGLSVNGVPALGTLYQTGELRSQPGDPTLHPAVHHGHHHGMDGALLLVAAILLARVLPTMRSSRLRAGAGAYLALMFCYGAANLANDFWLEQVVKRGWTDWEIPGVTEPSVSIAWGVIVLAAVALWLLAALRSRPPASPVATATNA